MCEGPGSRWVALLAQSRVVNLYALDLTISSNCSYLYIGLSQITFSALLESCTLLYISGECAESVLILWWRSLSGTAKTKTPTRILVVVAVFGDPSILHDDFSYH